MARDVLNMAVEIPALDGVLRHLERMEQGELTDTQEAVRTSTELVQRTWLDMISGHTVTYSGGTFVVRSVTGEYRRSVVDGLSYPYNGDSLTGEVSATSPHAGYVERGIPAHDMKTTHLNGPRVQRGKDGSRYITVPFRHQTPGNNVLGSAMPQQVYEQAKQLAVSRRANGLQTHWGERLGEEHGGEREKGHWTTGRYTGMVKMGDSGHTSYMTFRRLSENSLPEAWRHPGVAPRPVTKALQEKAEPMVIDLIRTGFELDLLRLWGG